MYNSEPQPGRRPKRRWYQFHLYHLLVLMAAVAIGCSWFVCRAANAKRQREAVEAIQQLGGHVAYDYEYDANDCYIPNARPSAPAWFCSLVGRDFVADVVTVCFGFRATDDDLENLRGFTKVKMLRLEDTRITDEGINKLQRIAPRLHYLGLGSHTSDAGLVYLRGLKNLKSLYLRETQITDAGLAHLSALPHLEYLDLHRTRITDAGLAHLTELPHLESLVLDQTQITDAGLRHLADMRNMEWLDLSSTRITDAGLEHLQGLANIKNLILSNTEVGDEGLHHIRELSALEWLLILGTQITAEGAEKLQRALPNCRILPFPVIVIGVKPTLVISEGV